MSRGWPPRSAEARISGRISRTTASASSSDTRPSGRHGSSPTRKQPSDFQTLPIAGEVALVEQGVADAAALVVLAQPGEEARARRSSPASTSGPSTARRRSKRVRDSVISSSTGPSNSTTSCSSVRITSQARRGERPQRRPCRYTPHQPVMRRWECSVRSPSKRMKQVLAVRVHGARPAGPRAARASGPWRGAAAASRSRRSACPPARAPTRRAAAWMVSPSGMPLRVAGGRAAASARSR